MAMKNQSIILYLLIFLVAVTFSAIGVLYQSSVAYNVTFYSALLLCVLLLMALFFLQKTHFKTVITKITDSIDRDWLQGLFSNFPMGIVILNATGNILYANKQACQIFNLE